MEDLNDELRSEYDLTKLKVRRIGQGRMVSQPKLEENDNLLPKYNFDYSKSRRNRFADAYKTDVTVKIIGNDKEISAENVERNPE